MDINSHISWKPGMPLKTSTFKGLNSRMEAHEQLLGRLFSNGTIIGVIPNTPLNIEGVFVRNNYELEPLRITALMPDGSLIDINETVQVNIPILYGNVYYLAVAKSDELVEFESDDVPYMRPAYKYSIVPLEELKEGKMMPLTRFSVVNGTFSIDKDYELPHIFLGSSATLLERRDKIAEQLLEISRHPKLVVPDAVRLFAQLAFELKTLNGDSKTDRFVRLLKKVVLALEYFVMPQGDDKIPTVEPEILDLTPFFEWLNQYLSKSTEVLDNVVIEDNSIDYEKLKEEIKAEIYERVNPELYERLINDLKVNLYDRLKQALTIDLTEYIDNIVAPRLKETVTEEVRQALKQPLYDELYEALYNALYVPEEEEELFIPKI